MKIFRTATLVLSCVALPVSAWAQSDQVDYREDVPMETYLAMLSQVHPAARDGAEAYMAAFQSRCGRQLKVIELRHAFADGDGDPTLMAMIRASQQRDPTAVQRLGANVGCARR